MNQTTDAREWARDFMRCKEKNKWTLAQIDEALMLGWFANAIETVRVLEPCDKMLPSEALCGFGGWITCRGGTLKVGDTHSAGDVAELVKAWCEANGLEETREGWGKRIVHPAEAE